MKQLGQVSSFTDSSSWGGAGEAEEGTRSTRTDPHTPRRDASGESWRQELVSLAQLFFRIRCITFRTVWDSRQNTPSPHFSDEETENRG